MALLFAVLSQKFAAISRKTKPLRWARAGPTRGRGSEEVSMPSVLVVDDEPSITLTLSLLLRRRGYEVYTAHSGAAALQVAAVSCPDFLLTDVAMPGMSGLELIAQFRLICAHARIVVFTGKPDSLPDEPLPVHRVLFKPVRPDDLLSCLKAA